MVGVTYTDDYQPWKLWICVLSDQADLIKVRQSYAEARGNWAQGAGRGRGWSIFIN